jgi:hypothetical protein
MRILGLVVKYSQSLQYPSEGRLELKCGYQDMVIRNIYTKSGQKNLKTKAQKTKGGFCTKKKNRTDMWGIVVWNIFQVHMKGETRWEITNFQLLFMQATVFEMKRYYIGILGSNVVALLTYSYPQLSSQPLHLLGWTENSYQTKQYDWWHLTQSHQTSNGFNSERGKGKP